MQLIAGRTPHTNGETARLWYRTTAGVRAFLGSSALRSVLVSCLAGLVLGALLLVLGLKSFPLVFALLFVLPWLIKDTFRLFVCLIVTWPILTLYVRIPLPGGIPDISYDRVLAVLIVAMILIDALVSKRKLMRITQLDVLILLYVAVQIATRLNVIWYGGMGSADLNTVLDVLLIPVLLYWAAKNLVVSEEQRKWLLYALVIAAVIVCPTGLIEQVLGTRIFKASLSMGGSEVNYRWEDAQGGLRAAGALGNPAIYGAFLGMGCLAAVCSLSLVKRSGLRLILLGIIAFLLGGVVACFTRSAWLSVFVVLAAAQFFIDGLWKKTLPILLLGGVILVLAWNVIPNHDSILERALTTKTVNQRLDLMNIAWVRFLDKPIMGWGAGALNIFGLLGEGNISHNIYLTFLVDGGIVLFLSFIAVAGNLLIRSVRIYGATASNSLDRIVLVAMVGNLLIFLLSGLALELRYFGYFNAIFWISAGVIDRLGMSYRGEGAADG